MSLQTEPRAGGIRLPLVIHPDTEKPYEWTEAVVTPAPPGINVTTDYCIVYGGLCTMKAGYRWNGPSGPALDTVTTMRASAGHDCGYRLIQEGRISKKTRRRWDHIYKRELRRAGVSRFRAWYHCLGVRLFGGAHLKLTRKR